MNPHKSFFYYSAYGLTIKSELVLPELRSIEAVLLADVTISFADLSQDKNLITLRNSSHYWHGEEGVFYLHIAEIADFQVTNGNTILVDAVATPSDHNIRIHLLGSCMGVLVQQRNILPLHASCISKGKDCIIISGQSGSGKSTLAMALNKKGYPLLSDDICVLHFSKGNPPYVYPSIPQIKIGTDSASVLSVDTSNLDSTLSKHIVPIDNRSEDQKYTIKTIFILESSVKKQLKIQELNGASKVAVLAKNTYIPSALINFLGKSKPHFTQCSDLAKLCKVKQIYRTNSLTSLPNLTSVIENEFELHE